MMEKLNHVLPQLLERLSESKWQDADDAKMVCASVLPRHIVDAGLDVTSDEKCIRIFVSDALMRTEVIQFYRQRLQKELLSCGFSECKILIKP